LTWDFDTAMITVRMRRAGLPAGHADLLGPRIRHASRRRPGLPDQPEHHGPPLPLPPV